MPVSFYFQRIIVPNIFNPSAAQTTRFSPCWYTFEVIRAKPSSLFSCIIHSGPFFSEINDAYDEHSHHRICPVQHRFGKSDITRTNFGGSRCNIRLHRRRLQRKIHRQSRHLHDFRHSHAPLQISSSSQMLAGLFCGRQHHLVRPALKLLSVWLT